VSITIAVLNASGNVGSALVDALAARGVNVRALVRVPERYIQKSPPNVHICLGNFEAPDTLRQPFTGIDKLFLVTPEHPQMVLWERTAIEFAKRAGVRHIVKLSMVGAGPDSPLTIAGWHNASEYDLKHSGIPWTILRSHFFMQNILGFDAHVVRTQSKLFLALHNAKFSPVDTRDIAAMAAELLCSDNHIGKTLTITGGEALSPTDMARTLSGVLGRSIEYVDIPVETLYQSLLKGGIPQWKAADMRELYTFLSTGAGAYISPSYKEITGTTPTTFEQFVRDHINQFN
jgi:uncharacterized protein YbjT (DUF2867 family)